MRRPLPATDPGDPLADHSLELDELIDLCPAPADLEAEALAGLTSDPKTLPCKLFYDQHGSELFEQICELPEYYLTRTETAILRDSLSEIAAAIGPRAQVIEPGSGAGTKTRLLLDALEDPVSYVPIDISKDHLREVAERIHRDYPNLQVQAICADFLQPIEAPTPAREAARRLVFFPGSTIGNFHPDEARGFLDRMADLAGVNGCLLIGFDRRKDPGALIAAYDDSQGVTAEFNRNALRRLNDDVGTAFDLLRFEHDARWVEAESRMEIHLVSTTDQTVRVGLDGHCLRTRRVHPDRVLLQVRAGGGRPAHRSIPAGQDVARRQGPVRGAAPTGRVGTARRARGVRSPFTPQETRGHDRVLSPSEGWVDARRPPMHDRLAALRGAALMAAVLVLLPTCGSSSGTEVAGDPPPPGPIEIGLFPVATGLTAPTFVTNAGDGSGRLFVLQQTGQIRVIDRGGNLLPAPFLDLSAQIVALDSFFDERGLLGLAFHPQFAVNGRFFVRYSAPRPGQDGEPCFGTGRGCHTAIVSEFLVQGNPSSNNTADAASERIVYQADEPQFNHNGGHLAFGPDGYLYVSLGDGGGAHDGLADSPPTHGPIGHGQDVTTPFGSILRIDVDSTPAVGNQYVVPQDNPFVGVTGLDEIAAAG